MPDKYITPQTQVLPLIVIALRNEQGVWEKYTSSYRPDYIKTCIGAIINDPKFKQRRQDIKQFELACGNYAAIAEAIDCLNAPTPHI